MTWFSLQGLKTRARRSKWFHRLFQVTFGGLRHKRWPGSEKVLWFDGYKHCTFLIRPLSAFEPDVQSFLKRELETNPSQVTWDVGANVGFWPVFLAQANCMPGKVVCYEPAAYNQSLLRRNCEANHVLNVQLRPVALSDVHGEEIFWDSTASGFIGTLDAELNFSEAIYGADRVRSTVPVTTIDDEVRNGVPPSDFIMLDVEGHELKVLQGGAETFRNAKPTILLELHKDGAACCGLLREYGYQLFDLEGRAWDDRRTNGRLVARSKQT